MYSIDKQFFGKLLILVVSRPFAKCVPFPEFCVQSKQSRCDSRQQDDWGVYIYFILEFVILPKFDSQLTLTLQSEKYASALLQ